jgi:hypothetical protein
MSYMDRLAGTTRTNAPIVSAGSFNTRHDARRIADARDRREYGDSHAFRETRSLMANRFGVCG